MHCKHCGNKIDNDSKFCSFCGGKVESIVQTSSSQQNSTNQSDNFGNEIIQNQVNNEKGLLLAFSVLVGSKLLWMVSDFINKTKTYEEVESYNNFILKPSFIIFWSVPLILAYFIKRNEIKTILLIISLVILGVAIYDNFIYTI